MSSRLEDLVKIRDAHRRHKDKLREQIARLGISVPPHLIIQLEDIEKQLKETQKELNELLGLRCQRCKEGFYEDINKVDTTFEQQNVFFRRKKITKTFVCDSCSHIMYIGTYDGGKEYKKQNLKAWFVDNKGNVVTILGVSAITAYFIEANQEIIVEFLEHLVEHIHDAIIHIITDIDLTDI